MLRPTYCVTHPLQECASFNTVGTSFCVVLRNFIYFVVKGATLKNREEEIFSVGSFEVDGPESCTQISTVYSCYKRQANTIYHQWSRWVQPALKNIRDLFVPCLIFHFSIDEVPWNMLDISVTRLTSHDESGWLNDKGALNIVDIFVTWLTSHDDDEAAWSMRLR